MALFLCVHILVGKNESDGKERRWKIFIGTLPAAPGIPEDADRNMGNMALDTLSLAMGYVPMQAVRKNF